MSVCNQFAYYGNRRNRQNRQKFKPSKPSRLPCFLSIISVGQAKGLRPEVPGTEAGNLKMAQSGQERVQKVFWCAILFCANPPAPYSIQKCPEPQICQKFAPTIVFRGSNKGDPNLSKICRKFVWKLQFSKFSTYFDKFGSPLLEPRKTIVGANF